MSDTESPAETPKTSNVSDAYFRDICYVCGVLNALSTEYLIARVGSERKIWCPNGHSGRLTADYVAGIKGKIQVPFENFAKLTCVSCGLNYMLESGYCELKRKDYSTFYCPNGCSQSYSKPPPPPPVPKTPADIDYEKLIAYHNALGEISTLEPKTWQNKKRLKQAILIAKNTLVLQRDK